MKLTLPAVPAAELVPLQLAQEQKDAIRAAVKSLQQDLAALPFMLDSDGLTHNFAHNVLTVTEGNFVQLAKLVGVDTETAARIEQRHADLRRANMRIRELEGLLGQEQPAGAIQPALKAMCRRLRDWWKLEGFGHVSEIEFGEYSARVKFSCTFIGSKPGLSAPEGATAQEARQLWLDRLQARGIVLLDDDGEQGVRDCGASRDALRKLFRERLGDATIHQFGSRETRADESCLREVEVNIYDLALIRELPVVAAKTIGA